MKTNKKNIEYVNHNILNCEYDLNLDTTPTSKFDEEHMKNE